jgi:hypothetical protein
MHFGSQRRVLFVSSVMACERIKEDRASGKQPKRSRQTTASIAQEGEEGPNIVLDILDALRGTQVILVGCDDEAALAIETALQLAPDTIAGLVLCGDLSKSDRIAKETGFPMIDSFLRRTLECPFLVVWDGETPSFISPTASSKGSAATDRCLILGGGSAPHRKQPEQFAWALTRFVEEKLAHTRKNNRGSEEDPARQIRREQPRQGLPNFLSNIDFPFGIDALVTSEGRLVIGRAVATAIFYTIMLKVTIVQYGLLRTGVLSIKSRYDTVDSLRRRVFQSIAAFIINFGYIPRLLTFKKASEDDEDEISANMILQDSDKTKEDPDEAHKEEGAEKTDKDETPQDVVVEKEEADKEGDINAEEDEARARYRPYFFLDHVVT